MPSSSIEIPITARTSLSGRRSSPTATRCDSATAMCASSMPIEFVPGAGCHASAGVASPVVCWTMRRVRSSSSHSARAATALAKPAGGS
jgi:hypothetical protein